VTAPAGGTQPQPRKKRRPERRDAILDAAVALFHDRGYHATGMDDIGAAAGITGPAVYRHFRNKEDILETIVGQRTSDALEAARSMVERAGSPRQALAHLIEQYVDSLLDDPALSAVITFERRTLRKETRALTERAERLYREMWVDQLCRLQPSTSARHAQLMVRAAMSLGLSAALDGRDLDAGTVRPLMIGMITRAIDADHAAGRRVLRRSASR
jgi:AcrR family transcriptional regulator